VSFPPSVLLEGIITGLNFGLLALGLVLIYRTNRVLNFAQGQLGVVGAVFLVKLHVDFGFNYVFSLLLALALAAAMGALCELVLRRLFNRPRVLVMVATIGLSQLLYVFSALPFILPKHLSRPFPVPISASFTIDGTVFGPAQVLTLVVAPLVALSLAAFIRLSPWGLAMRAMSENIDSARLSGVWVRRTSTLAWTLAGVLSAFTAILYAPGQTIVLTQPLSADLLVYALTAALIGAMTSLTVAFFAGIGVGVVFEFLNWNIANPALVQTCMFGLLLLVLLVRIAALDKGSRTEERSAWLEGSTAVHRSADAVRRRVGTSGVIAVAVLAALLPLVLNVGQASEFSNICIFAVIALSLTILTGWAGQVSLGQFALVGVGVVMASHLEGSVPLLLLLPFAGAVTAVIAVLVGLPALRVRGLYLAVTTLAFAVWMQVSVLATSCFTLPLVNKRLCTGLPDPSYTLVARPTLFGINLSSERAFAWFSFGVLVVSVLMVRVWRDRGLSRRLVSVRDNETAAAAMGIPVLRTKILAFALSGFMAGYAGVCFAFYQQSLNDTGQTFDVSNSLLVISMVVIGGLGSVPGAILGALYLVGIPAIFGSSPTIEFLTSGLGLVAFILYLPGGLAEVMHRLGDLVATGVSRLLPGRGAGAEPGADGGPEPGPGSAAGPTPAGASAPAPDGWSTGPGAVGPGTVGAVAGAESPAVVVAATGAGADPGLAAGSPVAGGVALPEDGT
jgi:ABC-type branched-subunit amino acid transport system permease subunit